MALGARPASVLKLIVGQGVVLAAIGVALGLAGAVALTRVLTTLLFGVTPTDLSTLALVVAGAARLRGPRQLSAGAARHAGGSVGRATRGVDHALTSEFNLEKRVGSARDRLKPFLTRRNAHPYRCIDATEKEAARFVAFVIATR